MNQTLGSQIFGHWYDTVGYVITSGIFFYFAFALETIPLRTKELLPAFIKNKKICIAIGMIIATFGIYKEATVIPPQWGWREIHSNENGDSLFVHPSSVFRDDYLIQYWSKITFKKPRIVGINPSYSTMKDEYVVNCKEMSLDHLQSFVVLENGQTVSLPISSNSEQTFSPIPNYPDHPDAILFRYFCSK
jgi:hypothetical protein